MEHVMKIDELSFDNIKCGKKIREYYINDEKRNQVRVGDTIRFLKLPNLDQELVVDVTEIETFDNCYLCYAKYFDEDFKDRYDSVEDVIQDKCNGEESLENGCVIFSFKKHRVIHFDSAACYLK